MTLSRAELIALLGDRSPALTRPQADQAARTLIDYMAATLAPGERIEIRNFGAFALRRYPPRMKRNPKTGQSVKVGTRYTVLLRPGKSLRERVNADAG